METNVTISDETMARTGTVSEQTGIAADDLGRQVIDWMIVEKAPEGEQPPKAGGRPH